MLASKGAQSLVYQVYRSSSNVCCCSYHSSDFQSFTNASDISWRPIMHSLLYLCAEGFSYNSVPFTVNFLGKGSGRDFGEKCLSWVAVSKIPVRRAPEKWMKVFSATILS